MKTLERQKLDVVNETRSNPAFLPNGSPFGPPMILMP